jgi:hypothetical protein
LRLPSYTNVNCNRRQGGHRREVGRAAGALGALLFLAATALGEAPVAPDRQVLILTRALAYDGNLKTRAGEDLLIAVVGRNGNAASEEVASAMSKAFKSLGNVKVQGLAVRAVQLGYASVNTLGLAIESQGIDALYVCPGLEADLPAIIELARKRQVITLGSREDHVKRGLSLGVFAVDAKPTIVVNLAAAKAEGAAFGSDLLRLAKVIR